jgi:hypothetical protein
LKHSEISPEGKSEKTFCRTRTPSKDVRICIPFSLLPRILNDIRDIVNDIVKKPGSIPGLAVILVGGGKDNEMYVRLKRRAAAKCGFLSVEIRLDKDVSEKKSSKKLAFSTKAFSTKE